MPHVVSPRFHKRAKRSLKSQTARVEEDVDDDAYRIDFQITTQLGPEEAEGVTMIHGNIVHVAKGRRETVAGKLHGYCVRWDTLARESINLFECCDINQELCDVASLVWDFDANTYKEALALEGVDSDLIVPWSIALLPKHRGKGVGLLALWRFLDVLGSGSSIAVVKPYPLNHDPEAHKLADYRQMQYERLSKVPLEEGKAKLARHWARLAFRPILGSDFFFRDMRRALPSLADLIAEQTTTEGQAP